MLYWRTAGLNYIQFSQICARVVRRSLQENAKKEALKREEAYAKINKWTDGKAAPKSAAAQQ